MNRKHWIVVYVVVAAAAVSAVGLLFWLPGPGVTIRLHNATKWRIDRVRVIHGDRWSRKVVAVKDLGPGETRTTWFDLQHEGTYALVVDFRGHGQLKGGGDYVEPGYVTDETITARGIRTETHF